MLNAKPINSLEDGKLTVIYGRSGSGKTWFGSTFPKPLLLLQIGDDGGNTIREVDGIDVQHVEKVDDLNILLDELAEDKKYKSILIDTFSLLVNEWQLEKVITQKKKMSQQSWGDLMNDSILSIKKAYGLSRDRWVILTCHEITDMIEGMEDELLPDVRPNVSRGVRPYLEGMANIGIHMIKTQTETEDPATGQSNVKVKFAAEIGPNAFYWTKIQIDPRKKVPKRIFNPTYKKLQQVLKGESK